MLLFDQKKKEQTVTLSLIILFLVIFSLSLSSIPDLTANTEKYADAAEIQGTATSHQTITPTITPTSNPTVSDHPSSLTNKGTKIASTQPPQTEIVDSPTSSIIQEILSTLNHYRQSKGQKPLIIDTKLQAFAQSRADQFTSQGGMDNHAGFQELIDNGGFAKFGFDALGENSSFGAFESAQKLIEEHYGGHPPHDENQLKSEWTHVGIGVNGIATNLIFGGSKRN